MAENKAIGKNTWTGLEIAVIGMAGRFPGARNIHEYWENLTNGVESISFFSDEELEEAGVSPDLIKHPDYVKACGIIEKAEHFDASFFGYTPGEAKIMNPQMRIFHECAWQALEDAGYNPESYDGLIGIYAGANSSFHWAGLSLLSGNNSEVGEFAASQLTDIAFLPTRISYNFNLKGPSTFVQTACSTSLVAIHLACRSVLSGECDMALAGGIGLNVMAQKQGYLYEEGMIKSPDGHCRTFDAGAKGTVDGNGVGLVVLKRLKKAIADRDHIYAIVKGTAINNDGKRKVGYSAPSVQGQVEVIRTAQAMSRIETESTGHIEAHGTATALGDPVEIEALTLAFKTDKKNFCPIGSVKSNIGHVGAAAGVAGFIKTVLVLKNKAIPPSLHFKEPSSKIDFKNSPFYVNTELSEWKNKKYPLRAGVSSFGIGGTNAHVVLEEAPQLESASPGRPFQLLLLSAKTQSALDKKTADLVEHFKKNPGINLADAAHTMQVGRKTFPYRKAAVCSIAEDAADALSALESAKVHTVFSKEGQRSPIFMFAGLGSQYVNMGADLYRHEPVFKSEMDRCFSILNSLNGPGLRGVLYPDAEEAAADKPAGLHHFETSQLAVFVLEYSLAKLIINYGVKPHAMIGYSLGEYTAACLSGVFSLEDALKLMVTRGRLVAKIPTGTMLSAPLAAKELKPLLDEEVAIAVDNGPSCILAGPDRHLDALQDKLKAKRCLCMRLPNSHAIHSRMMAPILKEFEEFLRTVSFNKPQIPYISNVTGHWITAEEAADPRYWCMHLTQTVRFADGVELLKKKPNPVFIEIGPGRDLSTLLVRHKEKDPAIRSVNLIRPARKYVRDDYYLLSRIGKLWLNGVMVDWKKFHDGEERYRIPLPTYPFERQKYGLGKDLLKLKSTFVKEIVNAGKKTDSADWYYIPSWKRTSMSKDNFKQISAENPCYWLVFVDKCGIGRQLLEELKKANRHVITVEEGNEFSSETDNEFTIQPVHDGDYEELFNRLSRHNTIPDKIVHLWGVTAGNQGDNGLDPAYVDAAQNLGFFSLLNIARALGKQDPAKNIEITVVTDNMQEVTGEDGLCPGKATVLGPIKSIPNEYPNIKCRSIDLSFSKKWSPRDKEPVRQLFNELTGEPFDQVVAYRNFHRWEQTFEPIHLEKNREQSLHLRQEGVYLVTGGLGGTGLLLAEFLAKTVRAKLVLTGRSSFPAKEEWQPLLNRDVKDDDGIKDKIQRLKALEDNGAEVLVLTADVTDEKQMRGVIHKTLEKFNRLNGVIHSAGLPGGELIRRSKRETTEKKLAAKVRGTLLLDRILKDIKLDFFVLCSSIASIQPEIGQAGYCAANNFLDAFAKYKFYNERLYTVSINWDRWHQGGMATISENMYKHLAGEEMTGGISVEQGVEAFNRILDESLPQVAVTPTAPMLKIEQPGTLDIPAQSENTDESDCSQPGHQRPDLDTEYIAPRDELEQKIARIWSNFFGSQQVGIRDDFFDLGGDSLRAMVIASKIHKELNIEIPLQEFFNSPTIEGLAGYINHNAEKNTFVSIEPVEEKEYYPMSSAQKRLYIIQQMKLENKSYNQPSAFMLDGESDRDRFEGVFRKLIQRHEGLRTSFQMIKGQPVQRIHREVEFEIEYYSPASTAQGTERKEEHQPLDPMRVESAINRFIRPFDLSEAPLLRVGLIETEPQKHLIMVDMHHIIADGMSIEILRGDFMAIYGPVELPPLRRRYRDFSEWQDQGKEKQEIKLQQAFWLKEFAGEIPVLNLPWDFPRPVVQSFEGGEILFDISAEETNALNEIARERGATLFMVLLAVYNIFLYKLSGQEDIVVGAPIAGRRHADLERIIGMFVNTLALRNQPSGEKTFTMFLTELRKKTLDAFENQDYQFENIIEEIAVERDMSRNPLFDVMFNLLNMIDMAGPEGIPDNEMTGGKIKNQAYKDRTSKFDLNLTVFEGKGKLRFSIKYCTKLFKEKTLHRFVDYFLKIINAVIQYPENNISQIEIMSDEEKRLILFDFNETGTEYPKDKNIRQLFEEQVERSPNHIAVIGRWLLGNEETQITYGDLNAKAGQLAALLQEKGIGPNTIVAIMVEPSLEMMIGIFAILKAGGAYLPIDPEFPIKRLDYILADTQTRIILTQTPFVDTLTDFGELINIEDGTIYNGYSANLTRVCAPGDILYTIYTSGTSGKPKGVLVKNQNMVNYVSWFSKKTGLTGQDKAMLISSFAYDLGYTAIYTSILAGGELHVAAKEVYLDPEILLNDIREHRITYLKMTPSLFSVIVSSPGFVKQNLAFLRLVVLGGEAIDTRDVERVYRTCDHLQIMNHYGPTETTIGSVACFIDFDEIGAYHQKPTIGNPIHNTKIFILDKHSNPTPIGVAAELCIGGDGVSRGYLNQPELTAEKFLNLTLNNQHLTLYKTGDLACRLPNGNIQFLGRIDHQVKIRGFRIELGEIERFLMDMDSIKEAVVIDKTDEQGDKYLTAYIVPDGILNTAELRNRIAGSLPAHMIPSYFVALEALPLTPNGKLDRKALPETGLPAEQSYTAPRDEIEKELVEIWSEVLGRNPSHVSQLRESLGIDNNFFELGGHSLKATIMTAKIQKKLDIKIDLISIFKNPTIRETASLIKTIRLASVPVEIETGEEQVRVIL